MALKQLSSTRYHCQRVFWIIATPVFVIVGLQTLGGLMPGAWQYLAPTLLPLTLMLLWRFRIDPNARIPTLWHNILVVSTGLFTLSILLALLWEPFATREALSVNDYRFDVFVKLAVLSLPLLGTYVWAFTQRRNGPKPYPTAVTVPSKTVQTPEARAALRNTLLELMGQRAFEKVIPILKEQFQHDSERLENVITLEGIYNETKTQFLHELIDLEERNQRMARVNVGLLDLINDKL